MLRSIKQRLAILLLCTPFGHASITVTSPERDARVVSGRTYMVEWDLGKDDPSSNRFEIDLYHDDTQLSYSLDSAFCGSWVTALCPYGEHGCPDSAGDYDVVLPAPASDLPESGYRIGVSDVVYDGMRGCSAPFALLTEEDVAGLASLNVTAPVDGDVAVIGESYDVAFAYDNGLGSSTDRFDIDLWKATASGEVAGEGCCGTFVTPLCDKWWVGCRDSGGSHEISIPLDTEPGFYRIRVARFQDDGVYDCSGVFEVVEEEFSYSFDFRV
ncbi:unnamed protein product [Ectocarpus sp. 12 AP-2014]